MNKDALSSLHACWTVWSNSCTTAISPRHAASGLVKASNTQGVEEWGQEGGRGKGLDLSEMTVFSHHERGSQIERLA